MERRKTASSEGRATAIPPTRIRCRSRRRTISAIEAGPSSTYSASASDSTTTRSRPGSSPIAAFVDSTSAPFSATDTTSWPICAFRRPGVPSTTIRPASMIASRSQSWSASSRYWVVSMTLVPPALIRRTSSQIVRRDAGSSPVVGSSRNRTSGEWTSALARSSRRFIPPE